MTDKPTFLAPAPEAPREEAALKIEHYSRIPFPVEVVELTEENLRAAAKWCGGQIRHITKNVPSDEGTVEPEKVRVPYVKVHVVNPQNDRQTKGFVGDRILKSDSGFKVYGERAFLNAFETRHPKPAEAHTTPRFRDARNGEYVTEAFAHANPDITVSERDYRAAQVAAQS